MLKYGATDVNRKFDLATMQYPLSVYMKITGRCMLKCEFCSQYGSIYKDMDINDAKKFLDELKDLGVVYIYYTGGEPLMYDNLNILLKYGYELGFKQLLVTNGVLFSQKEKRDLAKYLLSVGISLHGTPNMHNKLSGNINCYDKILENIKLLVEENKDVQININCTAVKENTSYDNFKFLAELCHKNDWKLTIARLNYIGNGMSYENINLNDMLEIINKLNLEGYDIKISNCIAPCVIDKKYIYLAHGCGAGQSIAAIESNGDVKICASSNNVIGNLKRESFKRIWNGKNIKKFKKLGWLPLYCRECKNFLVCKGGCKAELSGNFESSFCDSSVSHMFEKEWEKNKNKKISLVYGMLRKEKSDLYTIISIPAKKCNKEAKDILTKIDGTKTGDEVLNESKNKEKTKELLITLSIDKIISVEN